MLKRQSIQASCCNRAVFAVLLIAGISDARTAHAAVLQSQPTSAKSVAVAKDKGGKSAADSSKGDAAKPEKTAYDFSLPGADGKDVPLTQYKGKYIVLVNLGRKSTYSEQLAGLAKLSDTFKDKNVVVIGVPSNDFGQAEPGTAVEVQKAYVDAKVTFPVMALSKVSGDDQLPLYAFLTKGKSALPGGPVHWNFTKFVIGPKGQPLARLDPDVAPDSPEMLSTIDQILDGTWKPRKAADKGSGGKPADDDDDDD